MITHSSIGNGARPAGYVAQWPCTAEWLRGALAGVTNIASVLAPVLHQLATTRVDCRPQYRTTMVVQLQRRKNIRARKSAAYVQDLAMFRPPTA